MNDEEVSLADAEIADALDRGDELGKLVSFAFSFKIPGFSTVFAGVAVETADKEGN